MTDPFHHICIWGTSVKKVADEAQLASTLRYFQQRNPDIKVSVFSAYTTQVEQLLTEHGISGDCQKLSDITSLYAKLKKADLLVIIGGPFFEDRYQMLSIAVLIGLAKLAKTPQITFGTTIFPLQTTLGRRFFNILYSTLTVISSRDEKADEIMKDIKVKRDVLPLTDPRYLLDSCSNKRIDSILRSEGLDPNKPFVTITTRFMHDGMPDWVKQHHNYSKTDADRSYRKQAEAFSLLAKRYQLVIIPMHPSMDDDLSTASLLFANTDKRMTKVLQNRYTPSEIIGLFKASEFSILSRLGSTIFSVISGTPFLAISYESRMVDWMKAYDLSEYCFDWKDVSSDQFDQRARQLCSQRETVCNYLTGLRKEKKILMMKQAEVILSKV